MPILLVRSQLIVEPVKDTTDNNPDLSMSQVLTETISHTKPEGPIYCTIVVGILGVVQRMRRLQPSLGDEIIRVGKVLRVVESSPLIDRNDDLWWLVIGLQ
jgi:hypothetical protein